MQILWVTKEQTLEFFSSYFWSSKCQMSFYWHVGYNALTLSLWVLFVFEVLSVLMDYFVIKKLLLWSPLQMCCSLNVALWFDAVSLLQPNLSDLRYGWIWLDKNSVTPLFSWRIAFPFRLPSEILIKILSYLDASTLFTLSVVSKHFHTLANDKWVWVF